MERQKKSTYSSHQPPKHKGGVRYSSGNFIYEIYSSGGRRLNRISNVGLFLLSVLAGGFMCAASLLSLLVITDVTTPGVQYFLSGLGLTLGLVLITLTTSVLATEANIFIPPNFYNLTMAQGCLRLFRFWLISWIGNVIGAFLFAYLAYLSQEYSEGFRQILSNVAMTKLVHLGTVSYRGTAELILSGMLANWIIALIFFFAFASRNLINQFILFFLALTFLVATNFQYFPLNVSYFSLNTFLGTKTSLMGVFFYNLIPVTLGNILGAALFVAGPLLLLSRKR